MDATLKEINLWRSVKKFWSDGLTESVHFDKAFNADRNLPQWVGVAVSGIFISQISTAIMKTFVYSRQDRENEKLINLRDQVVDLMEPGYFDLYNTEIPVWEKIGGVLIQDIEQSDKVPLTSGSKMILIKSLIKWSAIY